MNRRAEDEELDKLLEEELIWEAEMIEQGLLSDNEIEERQMSKDEIDASFDRLVEKLKAEGAYHEDEKFHEEPSEPTASAISMGKTSNSGKIIAMPERNTGKGRSPKRRYGLSKVVGFGVVCVVSVLGASLSIEGNREYFLKKINYYKGNDTRINVETVEGDADNGAEEQEAIDTIENALGIKMPIFWYRPDAFEFYRFGVEEVSQCAWVEYQYKDVIFTLFIGKKDDYEKKSGLSIDGREIDSVYCESGDVSVKIMTTRDSNDDTACYIAVWTMDNMLYQFSGKMEREEFTKLVEKMKF